MNRDKLLKAKFVTMKVYLWLYLNPTKGRHELPEKLKKELNGSKCLLCDIFNRCIGCKSFFNHDKCSACNHACRNDENISNCFQCPIDAAGQQCDKDNSFYKMSLSRDIEKRKVGLFEIFKICRDWDV